MKHAAVEKKLDELSQAIWRDLGSDMLRTLAIIGVRTGGEPLARALHRRLEKLGGGKIPLGMLDITLYRDDLNLTEGLKQPQIRATEVPFALDGKRVLLVDDVLYTGRTVRAALDALCDLGRPAKIDLLVLIDRGHRQLPIKPDYVGGYLETERDDRVNVVYDDKKGWSVQISHGPQS